MSIWRFYGRFLVATVFIIVAVPTAVLGGEYIADGENFAGLLKPDIEEKVRFNLESAGYEVEHVRAYIPERFKEPSSYDSYEVKIPNQNRRGGKLFVNVTFLRGGMGVSRVNVMVVAKTYLGVVVANESIAKGSVISSDDVSIVRQAVGVSRGGYISDISEAVGKEAKRNIRRDFPIMENYLSTPKLVRAGETVRVVASSGTLTISALGRAKQDGNRGDWIAVVNVDSKKTISARVIDTGKVAVEF